jgi:hypothetical protein
MKYLILFFMIASCTKPDGGTDIAAQNIFYKRDISISHDGTAHGKLDLFTWTDCHMEHTQEDAGRGGIFSQKNQVEFTYNRDYSGSKYCPVEVGAYEAKNGNRHGWGFIDFESDEETVPATVYCNGYVEKTLGVSICQSKKGLMQKIVFPVAMETTMDDERCQMPISNDSKEFEFPMVPGFCAYSFREFDSGEFGGRFHRLTTLGYDKILIREVQK